MGHGFPAWPTREGFSRRDGGSGENVAAPGAERGRPSGSAAQQISEAWSHLSEATPHMSKRLIDYVCALPHLLASCCQQTCTGCFLCPVRFYPGFHLNSFSTNPNLTLSWEESKHSFTHLQGSQESCSLFQPAHLGRCVYTKDAPPVVICPLRREVKLFAWYIPFIFLMVMGEHLCLAVGFPWWNLQCCTTFLCIYPACRAPYFCLILQVSLKPMKQVWLLKVQRLGSNLYSYRVVP